MSSIQQMNGRRRHLRPKRIIAFAILGLLTTGAAPPPVTYVDLATPFERAALSSIQLPDAKRIAVAREATDPLLPGIYPSDTQTDRRISKALLDFPSKREGYDRVLQDFRARLDSAVTRFRKVFPSFTPPIPIYLYHSLGIRDGGSDYLEPGHRKVMLFGADMIAEYHSDSSLEPFFDHELFHLEHAHAFPDCDQFWCTLWQEGLAVDAAAAMTPRASDHELLLDVPGPIRGPTNANWAEALCFVAAHFDDTSETAVQQALQVGAHPHGLPDRFGYYVGYRIAQATGKTVPKLAKLDHGAARPVVRAALQRLMTDGKAPCAVPALKAVVTSRTPHPV